MLKMIDGGVTAAKGFKAAGCAAGIKKNGKADMALIVSDTPCAAAGTFTSNLVKAAPVLYDRQIVEEEKTARAVKEAASVPVIMKLSPNVTDITEIARAAEAGGADALSMINTLTGMKIDIRKRTFAIANRTGGLSGPAIHPVAVRMVWQCHQAVKIPIIGMGGIFSWEDAVEMMMAGATAISIGTALFRDPETPGSVIQGIQTYLRENGIADVRQLIGCVS